MNKNELLVKSKVYRNTNDFHYITRYFETNFKAYYNGNYKIITLDQFSKKYIEHRNNNELARDISSFAIRTKSIKDKNALLALQQAEYLLSKNKTDEKLVDLIKEIEDSDFFIREIEYSSEQLENYYFNIEKMNVLSPTIKMFVTKNLMDGFFEPSYAQSPTHITSYISLIDKFIGNDLIRNEYKNYMLKYIVHLLAIRKNTILKPYIEIEKLMNGLDLENSEKIERIKKLSKNTKKVQIKLIFNDYLPLISTPITQQVYVLPHKKFNIETIITKNFLIIQMDDIGKDDYVNELFWNTMRNIINTFSVMNSISMWYSDEKHSYFISKLKEIESKIQNTVFDENIDYDSFLFNYEYRKVEVYEVLQALEFFEKVGLSKKTLKSIIKHNESYIPLLRNIYNSID